MVKRIVVLVTGMAALASCGGGGGGKRSCGASDPCDKGSYCAHTADGNVCWPDAVAPVIVSSSVTCSDDPCRRDSVLHVSATVTDESAMGSVTAELGVDPDHPRSLPLVSGTEYALDVPLADVPFPYFEHGVGVTVGATDEAGNVAGQPGASVLVTRARWTKQLKGATALSLSSPALLPDGRIVLAGSDGKLYFVSKDGATSRVGSGELRHAQRPAQRGD